MAIEITVSEDEVRIELTGIHSVLALKQTVAIPLADVKAVSVMPVGNVTAQPGTWLRLPGTHLPGLARLGSYGRHPHREFWAVFGRPDVLVIEATAGEYVRAILGVADPAETKAQIEGELNRW